MREVFKKKLERNQKLRKRRTSKIVVKIVVVRGGGVRVEIIESFVKLTLQEGKRFVDTFDRGS